MEAVDRRILEENKVDVLFLGSGSGDYYLDRYVSGISNLRCPTQILLQKNVLIDFSSEAMNMLKQHGIPFGTIKDIFITHSQLDHFHAPSITRYILERRKSAEEPLSIWCSELVRYLLEQEVLLSSTNELVSLHGVEPFKKYETEDLIVTPIPANHLKSGCLKSIGEAALNYIVSINNKTILYAVDTGVPEEEVYEEWSRHKYHLIIIEATLGDSMEDPDLGHLNINQAASLVKRLRENGNLQENGRVCLAHLSESKIVDKKKTDELLKKEGMSLAYDGMRVSI